MAYYLTVEPTRKSYTKLDITKSNCFTRLSKTLKGTGCSLEEIDMFTTQFNNEDELREHLLFNGILSVEEMDRALTLRQQLKGELVKVRHDLLYQKDLEYLVDIPKLIEIINDKLWIEKDFRFVLAFANNYLTFNECSSTAPDVKYAATESIRSGQINKFFGEHDENLNDLMTRMVKLLIYKHYQTEDGKIHYKNEIVYRNLHSIVAFMNNYDKKYGKNLDDDVLDEKGDMLEAFVQPLGKVRTLSPKMGSKKYTLDDQISLFDDKK